MKNKKTTLTLSAFFIAGLMLMPVSGMAAGNAAGKKVFLDSKCNKCHSLDAEKIAKLPSDKAAEGEGEAEENAVKPPDLSKLSDDVTKRPEGVDAFLSKFLLKEATMTHEGKEVKHKKKFEGSPEDLKAVILFVQGK